MNNRIIFPDSIGKFSCFSILLLVTAIVFIPLWSTDIPPMLDYHNHLARQYIIANMPTSKHLDQFYNIRWSASPYLAMDAIVQALSAFMPVDVSGKIFLSLTLLLLALGPIMLNLALFGRVTPIALLGLLFIHNQTLTLGFVNYLFSVGFAICLLALWIRLRDAPEWLRLVIFPFLTSLLFFSHLVGFAIYILTVGSYELGCYVEKILRRQARIQFSLDRSQQINLISLILQCSIPLLIVMLFGPYSSSENLSAHTHGGLIRKIGFLWESFSYLYPPYIWTVDRIVAIALPLVGLGLIAKRWLVIPINFAWPLVAMLLLFFIMPMELFGGWGADHRLLPALGLLLIGSLRPNFETGWVSKLATLAIMALILVRVFSVSTEWRRADEAYAEYLHAFNAVSNGSKMFFAFGHSSGQQIGLRPIYHLPLLVLSKREVYVPYLFAASETSGTFTLQYHPAVEPLQRLSQGPVLRDGKAPNWQAIKGQFDYFFLVNEHHFSIPVPKELVPIFEGKTVKVYKKKLEAENN